MYAIAIMYHTLCRCDPVILHTRYMLGCVLSYIIFICTMHACVDLRLHKYSKCTPFRVRCGKTVLLNKNKVSKTVLHIHDIC